MTPGTADSPRRTSRRSPQRRPAWRCRRHPAVHRNTAPPRPRQPHRRTTHRSARPGPRAPWTRHCDRPAPSAPHGRRRPVAPRASSPSHRDGRQQYAWRQSFGRAVNGLQDRRAPPARGGAVRRSRAGRAWPGCCRRASPPSFGLRKSLRQMPAFESPPPSARAPRARAASARRAVRRLAGGRGAAQTTSGSIAVPPRRDAAHRVEEVVDLEHAILQQVAEPLGRLADELERVRSPRHLGEQEDADLGVLLAGSRRAARAPSSVCVGRHPHVDDGHVRPAPRRTAFCSASAFAAWADDLDAPPSASTRASPSRSSTESSAITTRTGSPPRRASPRPTRALDDQPAAHAPRRDRADRSGRSRGRVGAAAPVVLDRDHEQAVLARCALTAA